jgi:DNA polymerase III delta prime subunit
VSLPGITLDQDVPRKYEDRIISPRFGNFVTRNDQYYARIGRVRHSIKTYVKKHRPKRPLNILLAAPPGAGKSFLIKEIIKALEQENIKKITNGAFNQASFEEIYISALDGAEELFSMFRRVQSLNLEYKIPVVFFDEIDSVINEHPVYSKLLAPMWDGQFYIGKEKFLLGPAIFFFAGSNLSCEDVSEKILKKNKKISYEDYCTKWTDGFLQYVANQQKDKLPDFIDRIDSILRIPPITETFLGKSLQKELEDVACMLIRKHFEEAENIGKIVLKQLCQRLKKPNAIREVEKIIFSSTPPTDNHFDIYNLATSERDTPDGDDDKIKFEQEYWSIRVETSKNSSKTAAGKSAGTA